MDYQSIITQNSEYFHTSNIVLDILAYIGWGIIRFLSTISSAAESVFNAAYESINFTDSQVFKDFFSDFSVFVIPVLTISIIAIGLILVFSEKKPPVLKNFAIALVIIYLIPTVINYMNEGLISAKDELLDSSMTTQLVLSNVSDLNYIAVNEFDFSSTLADTMTDTSLGLSAINPAEHISPKNYDTDLQKQVFSHYLVIDDTGTTSWDEFDSKGMFDIFDPPYYYRYEIHYFQIIIFLIANILIMLFSAYAVIRMEYEIITTRIIQGLTSMELSSGQKTLKALEYFFNAYIVLFFIPVMLKVYLLWQQYVNTNYSNGLVRAFLVLFAALVIVDGPSVIEKIFGYDMGMSAGSAKVMSFMRIVQQANMQRHMKKSSDNNNNSNNRNEAANKAESESRSENFGANTSGNSEGSGAAAEPNINKSNNDNNMGGAQSYQSYSSSGSPETNNLSDNNSMSDYQSNDSNMGGAAAEPNINSSNNLNNSNSVNGRNSFSSSANIAGDSNKSSGFEASYGDSGVNAENSITQGGTIENESNNNSSGGDNTVANTKNGNNAMMSKESNAGMSNKDLGQSNDANSKSSKIGNESTKTQSKPSNQNKLNNQSTKKMSSTNNKSNTKPVGSNKTNIKSSNNVNRNKTVNQQATVNTNQYSISGRRHRINSGDSDIDAR